MINAFFINLNIYSESLIITKKARLYLFKYKIN